MGVRKYEFIVGPETSTLPTAGTPTDDNHLVPLGYTDDTYARLSSWATKVNTVQNAKDIAAADRFDGQGLIIRDKAALYYFDAASSATNDDDNVIQPTTGTGRWLKIAAGGAGGGGASEISQIPIGEDFNSDDVPAAAYLHRKNTIVVETGVNDKIDFNEGAGDLVATVAAGTYLFDTVQNIAEFTTAIKTALDAAPSSTGVYTVTFSTTTRKITIQSTVSHTLKFGTGANIATDIAETLGFAASDTSSATSHVADNEIDASFTKKVFIFKCDASFRGKSRSFQGVVANAGSKYDTKSIKYGFTDMSFTGKNPGDALHTARASIVIDTTNNKLDFNEGSGELNATITSGEYFHPYYELATEIETQLEAVGAHNYTVSYESDDDRFTILDDTGTVAFPFLTGTNNAATVATSIGFNKTDRSSSASHIAQNRIARRGRLLPADHVDSTSASIHGGVALSATSVHVKRSTSPEYIEINTNPKDWVADPSVFNKTYSSDATIGDQQEHVNGRGMRVILDDLETANMTYNFQYKLTANGPWQDSASTVSANAGANSSLTARWAATAGGNLDFRPKIAIDPDNALKAVCVLYRLNAGSTTAIFAYHTTDGGVTWAQATGTGTGSAIVNTAQSWVPTDIAIRQGKCVILMNRNDDASSILSYSDDSGSGYTTFSATTGLPIVFNHQYPTFLFIQYFPEQTGVSKYRLCCFGFQASGTASAAYTKGDLSAGASVTNIWADTNKQVISFAAIEQIRSPKNRIILGQADAESGGGSDAGLHVAFTNDDYNAGVLTTQFSAIDLTPDLVFQRIWNNPTASNEQTIWGLHATCFLLNGRGYILAQYGDVASGADTSPSLHLFKSNDVTTNNWELVERFGGSPANTSATMAWISGINALVLCWKELSTTVNLNTEGKIYSRLALIQGNDVKILEAEQIDGGKALSGYVGFPIVTANSLSAHAAWLNVQSAKDSIQTNRLA